MEDTIIDYTNPPPTVFNPPSIPTNAQKFSTMQIRSRLWIGPSRQIHRHPGPSALWSDPQVPNRCIMESSTTTLYRNGEYKSFYVSQKKSHGFHIYSTWTICPPSFDIKTEKVAIKPPTTLRAGSVIIANPGYPLSCAFWMDISLDRCLADEYCNHGPSIYFANFTLSCCRWRRRNVS